MLSFDASDCCMQSLHLDLERSTTPLDQWVLSRILFCSASSKANLKYWKIISDKNQKNLGIICGAF